MQPDPPAPQVPGSDELFAYLAEHDVPCASCGYNLRGLRSQACPECGDVMALRAYPDSERLDDKTRTALYLRYHDLVCRYCKASLHGSEDGVCPGCGRVYVARGLPRLERRGEQDSMRGCLVALGPVGLALGVILLFIAVLFFGVMRGL